jgi:hypothetical protein
MPVFNRALTTLADALRHRRTIIGSRSRRLSAGRQALLVLAQLRKGETHTALAGGFGIGTTTVFSYIREGIDVLAAIAPTLDQSLDLARRKAFVILDGTLLSIDWVAMASGRGRAFYSGCDDQSASPRSSVWPVPWLALRCPVFDLSAGLAAVQPPRWRGRVPIGVLRCRASSQS